MYVLLFLNAGATIKNTSIAKNITTVDPLNGAVSWLELVVSAKTAVCEMSIITNANNDFRSGFFDKFFIF